MAWPIGGSAQTFQRVLLLNSYNQDMVWTDSVTEGVKKTLEKHDEPIKLYIEFMDTKNFFSPDYLNLLAEKYQYKYSDINFDIIITSDDNATNFALKYRKEVFKDAPIVFCGVNDLHISERNDFKNITGVLEFTDVTGTIRAALKLQPGLKRIFFVIDDTTTAMHSRELINSIIPDFEDRLEFAWIEKMPMADVKKTVANLPSDSAIIFVMYNRDSNGIWYTYLEAIEHLAPVSNTPIYGMWDFCMNKGIVGGMITSGNRQGAIAARMAMDILNGKKLEQVPVVIQKSNQYMFDYTVMKRYALDPDLLPEDATLLNVPESVYGKYTFHIWTIGLLIVFLSGVIVVLLVNNRARREAEIELEELSHYQETLIEQRTEELVQRSRELEIANFELKKLDNLKTSVLNTVSHDLRTPLTSVLGFCKIINRDFKKFFKPFYENDETLSIRGNRIVDNLGIVELEGERLTRLINDFLDLSKIESGDMSWSDITIDPVQLFEQAGPILDGYFRASNITLVMEIGDDLPQIIADPDRLLQVLSNLVGNAAKFTDQGVVTLNAQREGEWLVVAVKDTGMGIPSDQIDYVFDTFYQVAELNTAMNIARGSGMGLAISKRIIEHYGGAITVRSTMNVGSTFTFRLPAAK
jgi:signal transduction histidine kinase